MHTFLWPYSNPSQGNVRLAPVNKDHVYTRFTKIVNGHSVWERSHGHYGQVNSIAFRSQRVLAKKFGHRGSKSLHRATPTSLAPPFRYVPPNATHLPVPRNTSGGAEPVPAPPPPPGVPQPQKPKLYNNPFVAAIAPSANTTPVTNEVRSDRARYSNDTRLLRMKYPSIIACQKPSIDSGSNA